MANLISLGQVLDNTWDNYKKHLSTYLKISLWLLVPAILAIIGSTLSFSINELAAPNFSTLPISIIIGFTLILLTNFVIAPIVSLWISMAVIIRADKPTNTGEFKKFLSFFWASILTALAVLAPILLISPGVILLIASSYNSGVWLSTVGSILTIIGFLIAIILIIMLSVELAFVPYSVALDGYKGIKSLKHSKELVKNRFWNVVLLFIVPKILFGIIFGIILTVTAGASGLLGGFAGGNITGVLTIDSVFRNLSEGIVSAFFVPLFLIADYYIYDSLKKTITPKKK